MKEKLARLLEWNKQSEMQTQSFVRSVMRRQPHQEHELKAFILRTAIILSVALICGIIAQTISGFYQKELVGTLCAQGTFKHDACVVWETQQANPQARFSYMLLPCWSVNNSFDRNSSELCRVLVIRNAT